MRNSLSMKPIVSEFWDHKVKALYPCSGLKMKSRSVSTCAVKRWHPLEASSHTQMHTFPVPKLTAVGLILCNKTVRAIIMNQMRFAVYSGAPSFPMVASIRAGIHLLSTGATERVCYPRTFLRTVKPANIVGLYRSSKLFRKLSPTSSELSRPVRTGKGPGPPVFSRALSLKAGLTATTTHTSCLFGRASAMSNTSSFT